MRLLLVGAGPMAVEYAKVLSAMDVEFDVVGRGDGSATLFEKMTGQNVTRGGLSRLENPIQYEKAIIAVSENMLGIVTREAIDIGIRQILVEKPGGLTKGDILEVRNLAKSRGALVYIGYNRRYYASVKKAKELIAEDGGVTSFNFEFTEWSHIIESIEKAEGVKESWLLANSSHVIDLAFYLGGKPVNMDSHVSGALSWHPSGARFAGTGVSETGALFTYCANWDAPGRWGVEMLTKKHRFFLKPLEKLQVQNIGTIKIEEVEINDELDFRFKPGLYLQVEYFLSSNLDELLHIDEQCEMLYYYDKIEGNI